MNVKCKLYFECSLGTCDQHVTVYNTVEHPPWCFGKENTHSKQMRFVPEKSVGEPSYNWKKQDDKKGKIE